MKFLSKIIFAFIIFIFIIALPSCSNNEKKVAVAEKKNEAKINPIDSNDCIEMTFNTQKKLEFRDTTIKFRRSIFKDMKVLICCDTNQISYELEKILFASIHFRTIVNSKDSPYYVLLLKSYGNNKEIGLFFYNERTSWEENRFLIQNNKIIGINQHPTATSHFLPPEQCYVGSD